MQLALNLAKKGSGKVHPNPLVGCVIVKNGKIAGKGFHEYFGGPHAEVNALRQAGKNAKGATLYVNLEPCNHWGKTPPCTEAIIRAGISRVVIGTKDRNPCGAETGSEKLKKNGVALIQNILKNESKKLNKLYFSSIKRKKTHVILKMAMSIDGKIATRTGDSKWISGNRERKFVHRLRTGVDGILVGINTVIRDNPQLSSHGMGKNPVRVVIDPYLKTPKSGNVIDGKIPCIIIYNNKKVKVIPKHLKNRKAVRLAGLEPGRNNEIDFKKILKTLNKMSICTLLIEGGGETAARALESKVVDEIIFVIAPKIIGGRDAKSPVEGLGVDRVFKAINLNNTKIKRIGKDYIFTSTLK